ncbi:FAD-binding protein [Hyalangium gracile]|uniref:FAD-binding protein n=1 Tax=Hyalangium gracile TaxID=394092 RepID=UPI001CCCAADF|nr:FAD-binding protein [Hyalangium gracile]
MPDTSSPLRPDSQGLVTAFDVASGSWLTAGQTGSRLERLPSLEGRLLVSSEVLEGAANDFGLAVPSRRPSVVLQPGSEQDVVHMVRFARAHGLKIGARGTAHTMFGHTQVDGGIVIDMRKLDRIYSIGEDRAEVDAGVLWSELVSRAVARGRTPPVLTDLLEMSVGGTLSVGGVSGTSYRYGTQVDTVLELRVVTGEGELVSCSPNRNQELFNAVLAGLGQCGIIVRATLRLVPAPARVRLYGLKYASHEALIQDELTAIRDGRFDYVLGVMFPGPDGKWEHLMHSASYLAQPDDERMLAGLSHQQSNIKDVPYLEWVNSLSQQLGELKRLGQYVRPHPWCDLLVPSSRIASFVSDVLREVAPTEISRVFPLLLYPFNRQHITRPLFRVPDEDTFFLFDILRTVSPETRTAAQMVAHNRLLFELNRSWGGTHYAICAVGCSHEDWKRHFGSAWDAFAAAKRRYDPDGVLTPGPGIFG